MKGQEKINIQHPEAWELLVSIDDRRVRYVLYTRSVEGSLITGEVDRLDDTLQSLEDAIYETAELLNDYKRVRVVLHSRHFVVLPMDVPDEDCPALLREAFPGDDGDAALSVLPLNGVKIAYMMPNGLMAFLGRTFNYPEVCHYLMPLCEHFKELSHGNDLSRMFLHMTEGGMDMAIYRKGNLMCANTYEFTNAQDAAYLALTAWRAYGLDQLADELQLLGDNESRAAMTPLLREYVKYVMPAVYPAAAMQLGRNAMQAPLELILLALCE